MGPCPEMGTLSRHARKLSQLSEDYQVKPQSQAAVLGLELCSTVFQWDLHKEIAWLLQTNSLPCMLLHVCMSGFYEWCHQILLLL